MGLDVKIYKGVKKATIENYNFIAQVIDESWKDRIKNLEHRYYKGTDLGMFISYPCSTHNEFRSSLCAIVTGERHIWKGRTLKPETPFYEFFEFADNEGCIDWETAQELHKDFKANLKQAQSNLSIQELETYKEWTKVFRVASKVGSVIVYS